MLVARTSRDFAFVAIILLGGLVIVAVLAPRCAPYDPHDVLARGAPGLSPCRGHWLGTDGVGRDVLSAIMVGAHAALAIGLGGATIAASIGLAAGILTGYCGGGCDTVIMRLADVLLALPSLPLLLVLAALWRADQAAVLWVLALLSWPRLARLVRAAVLALRAQPFVEAAIACGASSGHIMLRHILPAVLSLVVIDSAGLAARLVLAEASLSYLGLGDPRAVTWGKMLAEAQRGNALLLGMWWWIVPPGVAIFLCALALMLAAVALESSLHPELGSRTCRTY